MKPPEAENPTAAVQNKVDRKWRGGAVIEEALTEVDARAPLGEVKGAVKSGNKVTVGVQAVRVWAQGVGAAPVVAAVVGEGKPR